MLLFVFLGEVAGWEISLDLPPCYFLLGRVLSEPLIRTGLDPLWDPPGQLWSRDGPFPSMIFSYIGVLPLHTSQLSLVEAAGVDALLLHLSLIGLNTI